MLFRRTGMPADHLWLGFAGKVLKDHKNLVSYCIQKDSTLDAHCRKTIRTGA
uniref:Ubiquitin-like domain-containing protein n=1 Tax=Rhizophora mucronata TaxID=61149 RepID=A0A2P2PZ48_RHIMU